jgi:hypothetical protein
MLLGCRYFSKIGPSPQATNSITACLDSAVRDKGRNNEPLSRSPTPRHGTNSDRKFACHNNVRLTANSLGSFSFPWSLFFLN